MAARFAKLVKYLWIDAYVEVQGNNRDFICTYGPKMIHLIGSPAYDNGKITLGTAEGGLKVTLYNINALNPNSVDVEMMNRWYFSTMHHEFSHILHQTIEFPQDFYAVSSGKYIGNGWVNVSDEAALGMGFITAYGGSEVHEDFAELVANYVNLRMLRRNWSFSIDLWGSMITFVALVGSLMVSYVRARAEGLGLECKEPFSRRVPYRIT